MSTITFRRAPRRRSGRLGLHLGGTLGPFGSYLVIPVLPEIADHHGVSLQVAAWSVSAYTFTLAAAMFVTGRAARRWGLERTVRVGYLAFALASVVCVLAPGIAWFLLGRGLQGMANALTTPLLVVILQQRVESRQLGRELGLFGSAQAAGMAFAPAVGGALAIVDYRLGFVLTALVSLALALTSGRGVPAVAAATPRRRSGRSRVNPLLLRSCLVALSFNIAASGVLVLAATLGEGRLDLAPSTRGLIIGAYGLAGLVAAPAVGRLVDALGVRATGFVSFATLAATVTATGWSGGAATLVVAVAVAGATATASRVVTNTLALASSPADPAGAASASMAMMFLGAALAPLLLLPAYGAAPHLAFALAGLGPVLAAGLVVLRLPGPAPLPAPAAGDS